MMTDSYEKQPPMVNMTVRVPVDAREGAKELNLDPSKVMREALVKAVNAKRRKSK